MANMFVANLRTCDEVSCHWQVVKHSSMEYVHALESVGGRWMMEGRRDREERTS